ncbi:MAG: hypothetical protein HOQ24_18010, partial [Mycobacteriaceae bacterium]|nr:hypothetical protein [Mycobacteriaceae bacterium]
MQLAESGRIRRVLPLLILALPLLAGAVYAGVKPMFGVTDRVPTVAVVANPGNGTTPAAKMVSALTGNQDFDWLVTDADQAAAGMNDGSVLATVTVPDGFGKPGQDADSRRIAVVPGHTDLDAATYANLVRDVSASAAQVGVGDLLVGVSKARNGLADAQFTAGVIKTAANQAGDAFNNAFGTIDQLMAKAAPMLQSAQGMAATIRQLSGTVNDVSEKLALAATGLRGLNLTIGDIQNGANALGATADSTAQALTATGPLRTQLRTVLAPIAGALQMSGIPDAQKMATQITSLLDLVAGPSNPGVQLAGAADGARMLANQLNDLSGLVGARVTPTTKVSDVFTLGANRLRELGMFMTQGEKMLSEVVGQVGSATGQVPEMKGTIKTQLDQFKTVASQLVSQLNASAAAMPRTSAPNAGAAVSDPVALDESGGNAIGENVTRTVLVLLVGALLIALLR